MTGSAFITAAECINNQITQLLELIDGIDIQEIDGADYNNFITAVAAMRDCANICFEPDIEAASDLLEIRELA